MYFTKGTFHRWCIELWMFKTSWLCFLLFFHKVERKRLDLLYCFLNSLYEQINVLNLGYKTLNSGMVWGEQTLADYSMQRETPQRIMFSFAGCDMENINGGGAATCTITLMITCKLKTNLFIFCCCDSAVELHVSFLPSGTRRKYSEVPFFIRCGN